MARPARERINRAGVTLAPLDVPKAADVLADAFRRRIFADEWPEGTALPHERELAEQTNMSRHAVREAFRILEIQGLIRMRPGRGGGAFVHRPDEQVLAQAITLLIRGRRLQPAALHETREAIEPFCAELAAYHRTDDDLAALDEAVERMARTATSADFIEAGAHWHAAVATAGRNPLLIGIMTGLSPAIHGATETHSFLDGQARDVAVDAHRSISDAIRRQDGPTAQREMRCHMRSNAEAMLEEGMWIRYRRLDDRSDDPPA